MRALLVLLVFATACSTAKTGPKPKTEQESKVEVSATVVGVDTTSNKVLLETMQGKQIPVAVDPATPAAEALKVGDVVTATYRESMAVAIAKTKDSRPEAQFKQKVDESPAGERPARTVTNTTELSATVEEIDYDTREVSLKSPDGSIIRMTVDPNVEHFENIERGDEVLVTYVETFSVRVGSGS